MKKRIFSLLVLSLAVLAATGPVLAAAVPDMSRLGSITVRMQLGGMPVSGGSLTLYPVAEIVQSNGDYRFRAAEPFESFDTTLQDDLSPELAKTMAAFARSQNLAGLNAAVPTGGIVVFSELPLGLYLVVQDDACRGCQPMEPFLIGLPNRSGDTYLYEVDATPKAALLPDTPSPSGPQGPSLPQTGQLNWPVPLLAVLGIGLFALGWILRFPGRKDAYEE